MSEREWWVGGQVGPALARVRNVALPANQYHALRRPRPLSAVFDDFALLQFLAYCVCVRVRGLPLGMALHAARGDIPKHRRILAHASTLTNSKTGRRLKAPAHSRGLMDGVGLDDAMMPCAPRRIHEHGASHPIGAPPPAPFRHPSGPADTGP